MEGDDLALVQSSSVFDKESVPDDQEEETVI